MKTKIREPGFNYSVELKQLPSKQLYLFYIKKQNKQLVIPVKILPPPESEQDYVPPAKDISDYLYDIHVTQNNEKLEEVYLNTVTNFELIEEEIRQRP